MRFSEYFKIKRLNEDDWYDPLLNIDTALGIDPFLIFTQRLPSFEDAHIVIANFFDSNFKLLASSRGDEGSPPYRRAVLNMRLGEMEELCLGMTEAGTNGAGAGEDLSERLASGIMEAITLGVEDSRHFEEVSIFRDGFGLDRISDIIGHIVLSNLVDYTVTICERHKIRVREDRFVRGKYDYENATWNPLLASLPCNPYNNKSLLLVPRLYLREDPTISADGFWRYSFYHHNDELRRYFGQEITSRVDKATILSLARRNPEYVREYLQNASGEEPRPYNIQDDPDVIVRWDDISRHYISHLSLNIPITTQSSFIDAIKLLIDQFKHFVEENGGWYLLRNDDGRPRRERVAQRLILGIVMHGCRALNINVAKEAEIGRGLVDFQFSIGYALRALVEVKLVSNSRFWNGLERQLPAYLRADSIRDGYLVAVAFTDDEIVKGREFNERLKAINGNENLNIAYILVDARRPIPASKL